MASKMKKGNNTDIKNLNRAEAERLSNRLLTLTVITILYAFLMLFLQNMSRSSETVLGAQGFIYILFWGSIVGAMICAAMGAYKEKRELFIYCAMFLYVLWSTIVIQYCGVMGSNKAYTLVYVSLAVIFVMTQIFSVLVGKGKPVDKKTATVFAVVSIAFFVLFCLVAIGLRYSFLGLF